MTQLCSSRMRPLERQLGIQLQLCDVLKWLYFLRRDFVLSKIAFAKEAEARAILHALFKSEWSGHSKIHIFPDTQEIMESINGKGDQSINSITGDINPLSSSTTNTRFSYIPRKFNSAAHLLAKHSFLSSVDYFLESDILGFVLNNVVSMQQGFVAFIVDYFIKICSLIKYNILCYYAITMIIKINQFLTINIIYNELKIELEENITIL